MPLHFLLLTGDESTSANVRSERRCKTAVTSGSVCADEHIFWLGFKLASRNQTTSRGVCEIFASLFFEQTDYARLSV